jgi:hypothetical protein
LFSLQDDFADFLEHRFDGIDITANMIIQFDGYYMRDGKVAIQGLLKKPPPYARKDDLSDTELDAWKCVELFFEEDHKLTRREITHFKRMMRDKNFSFNAPNGLSKLRGQKFHRLVQTFLKHLKKLTEADKGKKRKKPDEAKGNGKKGKEVAKKRKTSKKATTTNEKGNASGGRGGGGAGERHIGLALKDGDLVEIPSLDAMEPVVLTKGTYRYRTNEYCLYHTGPVSCALDAANSAVGYKHLRSMHLSLAMQARLPRARDDGQFAISDVNLAWQRKRDPFMFIRCRDTLVDVLSSPIGGIYCLRYRVKGLSGYHFVVIDTWRKLVADNSKVDFIMYDSECDFEAIMFMIGMDPRDLHYSLWILGVNKTRLSETRFI